MLQELTRLAASFILLVAPFRTVQWSPMASAKGTGSFIHVPLCRFIQIQLFDSLYTVFVIRLLLSGLRYSILVIKIQLSTLSYSDLAV